MHPITEYLYKLVSIQSDTGTVKEKDMAAVLYNIIKEDSYFIENPDYCGAYEENDILGRPVVWALKRGKTNKTIILMGHYDAVDIETYGVYKPYALNPDILKEKFIEGNFGNKEFKRHLNDERWAFGRGIGDMKAGLAINLYTLFNSEEENVNILFVAVPDEENMSSGAIMSVPLYLKLKDRFDLDYKICIVSEPENHEIDKDIDIIEGSMGKFMPIILVKGILAHAAYLMRGLNSGFILSEIIRNIELDISMITSKNGIYSQPPTVQLFRDLKVSYDVSIPEYSVAFFNFLFLKTKSPQEYMQRIKDLIIKSVEFSINKYHDTYNYLVENNLVNPKERLSFSPKVFTLSELKQYLSENKDGFKTYKDKLNKTIIDKVLSKEMTLQDASIYLIKSLLEYSELSGPTVVMGISPPYYPAVANDALIDKNVDYLFKDLSEKLKEKYGFKVKHVYSNLGMTDMSYLSCTDPAAENDFMNNLTVPSNLYDISFDDIAKLNIPTYKIGPNSREIHQIGERVYLPDIEENIPLIFKLIINNLVKSN